jgi:hypothetical protein
VRGFHPATPPWLGPVKVRVVRSDSPACFEAGFFSPTHNDEERYKAANWVAATERTLTS